MHEEGISTLRVCHKGWQPLIEGSKNYVFSIFMLSFLAFYVFYFFVVDKGVSLASTFFSIAMRKSDLRSFLRKARKVCGVLILDF